MKTASRKLNKYKRDTKGKFVKVKRDEDKVIRIVVLSSFAIYALICISGVIK